MFDELRGNSYLFGANAPFIEALYDRYLEDPSSVESRWRSYFDELQRLDDGARDVSHAAVQESFAQLAKNRAVSGPAAGGPARRQGTSSQGRTAAGGPTRC